MSIYRVAATTDVTATPWDYRLPEHERPGPHGGAKTAISRVVGIIAIAADVGPAAPRQGSAAPYRGKTEELPQKPGRLPVARNYFLGIRKEPAPWPFFPRAPIEYAPGEVAPQFRTVR